MPRIRIFTAAAVLVSTALLSQSAAAQTTQPLALLAGLKPPHETKTGVHAKTAHKAHRTPAVGKWKATTRLAANHHQNIAAQPEESQITPATLPETAAPTADPAPAADSAPPADAAQNDEPNQIVVAGQMVQIATPAQVNAIDLAADKTNGSTAAMSADSATDSAAASPAVDTAAATATPPEGVETAAPAQAVLVAPVRDDANAASVGSASWIAQVLAALGGAVTAGAVAWFLIGSGPVRTYG